MAYRIKKNFFQRESHQVAKELLGKNLVRRYENGSEKVGKIVEVEVYQGFEDKASHASTRRITARNQIMFGPGGYYYIYLIYGMYWNLNIVTEDKDFPAAVLIRALEPIYDSIQELDKLTYKEKFRLASGPGKLCRWLELDKIFNGMTIDNDSLYFVESLPVIASKAKQSRMPQTLKSALAMTEIGSAKRIGVDYAGECADYARPRCVLEWSVHNSGVVFSNPPVVSELSTPASAYEIYLDLPVILGLAVYLALMNLLEILEEDEPLLLSSEHVEPPFSRVILHVLSPGYLNQKDSSIKRGSFNF